MNNKYLFLSVGILLALLYLNYQDKNSIIEELKVVKIQKQTLEEKLKQAETSMELTQVITKEGETRTVIKYLKKEQEVTKTNTNTTLTESSHNKQAKINPPGVRVGVAIQNPHQYTTNPQFLLHVSSPILGPIGVFGNLSTNRTYSLGAYWEF